MREFALPYRHFTSQNGTALRLTITILNTAALPETGLDSTDTQRRPTEPCASGLNYTFTLRHHTIPSHTFTTLNTTLSHTTLHHRHIALQCMTEPNRY